VAKGGAPERRLRAIWGGEAFNSRRLHPKGAERKKTAATAVHRFGGERNALNMVRKGLMVRQLPILG